MEGVIGHADQYILTVGRIETRKNYVRLLRAFEALSSRIGCQVRLLIVGAGDHGANEFFDVLNRTPCKDNVHVLGDVSSDALLKFYRGSDAFVYPSLAEGFGIPPLEAMAAGLPVASSQRTAMAEVLGGAAAPFDPVDVESMADAMELVLCDRNVIDDLVDQGRDRVRHYSWADAADSFVRAIQEL
jgi:glycosyltransferase involved in cell wall biosynthesis